MEDIRKYYIFTDGGAVSDGKGGYYAGSGYSILNINETKKDYKVVYHGNKTNNYSELWAINESLKEIYKEVKDDNNVAIYLFTDSLLCVNSINVWIYNWVKNMVNGELRKSNGEKVLNQELLKEIWTSKNLLRNRLNIYHVNSHVLPAQVNNAYNKFITRNKLHEFDFNLFTNILKENEFIDKKITEEIDKNKK